MSGPKLIDENLELVRKMGSKKGYDPMPPDQYLFFLTSPDEIQRVVAWVRSKTIRKGFRSPFAVAENGTRPLKKADMAREVFGGSRAQASRAWDRTAALGLVHEDANGFLCLTGAIQIPRQTRRRKCEPIESLRTQLPAYLVETIDALPEGRKEPATRDYLALVNYRRALEADLMTMARIHCDDIEDNINRRHLGDGNGRKRLDRKHRPDLRQHGSKLLQLELLPPEELREFVQSTPPVSTVSKDRESTDSTVQSASTQPEVRPEPYSQAPQRVANDVPLKPSEERHRGESSSSLPMPEPNDDDDTRAPSEPDRSFAQSVMEAFLDKRKPVPTPAQVLEFQRSIPEEPEARAAMIEYLLEKMPRIKHPGALPSVAAEFASAWPAIKVRRQEQQVRNARQGPGPWEATPQNLRAQFRRWAVDVEAYPTVAAELERLSTEAHPLSANLEALESLLTDLDVSLIAAAESSIAEDERRRLQEPSRDLKKAKALMTGEQYARASRNSFECNLRELRNLPRISLFYATERAPGAAGASS